ncbi:hypothetical protein C8R44DRAFT_869303 [Mycena epipterygia]|nr:hypothetical protein C8R44DRAFT_869303 [Mycena epipterygia]
MKVPDAASLASISIPGRHESIVLFDNFGASADTLTAPLNGVRMFDIHLRVNAGSTFVAHHGAVYQKELRFQSDLENIENMYIRPLRKRTRISCLRTSPIVTARNLVFAVGIGGRWPIIPDFPGKDSFLGESMHSGAYTDASSWAVKRVPVVGSSTTTAFRNSACTAAMWPLGLVQTLHLSGYPLSYASFRTLLGGIPNLLNLSLHRIHIINRPPDADPIVLPHLRALRVCALHACPFSAREMFRMLRAFPVLTTFRLDESLLDILDLLGMPDGASGQPPWPKMQTLALTDMESADVGLLCDMISHPQTLGTPLRRIFLDRRSRVGSLRRTCVLNATLGEPPTDLGTSLDGSISPDLKGYICPLDQTHHRRFRERLVVVLNFWLINLFVAVITNTFSAIRSETKKSAFGATNLTPIVPYSLEDT